MIVSVMTGLGGRGRGRGGEGCEKMMRRFGTGILIDLGAFGDAVIR